MARDYQKPLAYGTATGGEFGYEPITKCAGHWRSPLAAGKGTILVSSYRWKGEEDGGIKPDAGIYLADQWLTRMGMVGNGVKSGLRHPSVLVDWPDMQAPKLRYAQVAVEWVRERLDKGEGVEIACVGGHGRTGTLAACVLVSYGSSPSAAIAKVREEICSSCIETKSQKDFINSFKRLRRE